MPYWVRSTQFCSSLTLALTIPLNVALAYDLLFLRRVPLGEAWEIIRRSRPFWLGCLASICFVASGTIQARELLGQNAVKAIVHSLRVFLTGASVMVMVSAVLAPLVFLLARKLRPQNKQE